jgi:hypothetical protein
MRDSWLKSSPLLEELRLASTFGNERISVRF